MRYTVFFTLVTLIVLSSCGAAKKSSKVNVLGPAANTPAIPKNVSAPGEAKPMVTLEKPLNIRHTELLDYAKTFLNVPYLYGSADPQKGFDCSGFLYHVFRHFNVKAPRTSYNYENVGKNVAIEKSAKGDLILFTGSDNKKIGHIGIITETSPKISFIHASTSKGVIISALSGYYQTHFVKVIRILK